MREAGYEAQVATALAAIERPDGTALRDGIEASFEEQQGRQWRDGLHRRIDIHRCQTCRVYGRGALQEPISPVHSLAHKSVDVRA